MMTCEQATALVEKKRDQKLDFSERIGLWLHMAYCRFCALFAEQSRIIDECTKAYADKASDEKGIYKLDVKRKAELSEAFDAELRK